MKLFISWSGNRSQAAAAVLRAWLPDVIQGVQPWLSAVDIAAGERWSRSVEGALSASRFGILCITKTNQGAPWLLFEAGALAKTIDDAFVCPYLIGVEPHELDRGPLTLFQAKVATKDGTLDLVRSVNRAMQDERLSDEKLERSFERWWPDLEKALVELPPETATRERRSADDVMDELLISVRELLRRARDAELNASVEATLLAQGLMPYRPPSDDTIALRRTVARIERALGRFGFSDLKEVRIEAPDDAENVDTPGPGQGPPRQT
jgi:hypothetical protein